MRKPRLRARIHGLAIAALASCSTSALHAAETTTTVWTQTGTGNVDSRSASNTFPSGLGITVNLGGVPVYQPQGTGQSLDDTNGTAAMYGPITNMPVSGAGSLGIQTNISGVQPVGQPGVCGVATNAQAATVRPCGTMSIIFEHPVRNPTFHFAGVGGGGAPPGYYISTSHSLTTGTHVFVPPGSGGRVNMAVTATTVERAAAAGASANCTTGAAPLALCGSAPTSLTAATIPLNLNVRFDGGSNAPNYGNDGYRIQWTVDEDFGDAPATYDVGGAASHVLSDLALGTGGTVTAEYSTQIITIGTATSPNSNAAANGDSDNAFTAMAAVNGSAATHTIAVPVSAVSKTAQLCGWIDFNRDADFDNPSERTCASVASGATSVNLSWTLPAGTAYVAGNSYARLRLGYDSTAVQSPTGAADSGEVEDYTITLLPRVRLDKVVTPVGSGLFNLSISPTVLPAGSATVSDVGNGGTTGFASVNLNTSITISETAGTGTNLAGFTSSRTCVNRAGATVLASATATSGSFTTMSSASTGANATPATQANIDNSEITCTFTNTRNEADLSLTKTNTPGVNGNVDQTGDTATAGTSRTYTIVVTNNGPSSVTGAVVTDAPNANLTCNATVTCTGSVAGVCPTATTTLGQLTGAGYTLGTMPNGATATFALTCTPN